MNCLCIDNKLARGQGVQLRDVVAKLFEDNKTSKYFGRHEIQIPRSKVVVDIYNLVNNNNKFSKSMEFDCDCVEHRARFPPCWRHLLAAMDIEAISSSWWRHLVAAVAIEAIEPTEGECIDMC